MSGYSKFKNTASFMEFKCLACGQYQIHKAPFHRVNLVVECVHCKVKITLIEDGKRKSI